MIYKKFKKQKKNPKGKNKFRYISELRYAYVRN